MSDGVRIVTDEERRETLAHLVETVGFTVDEAQRAMRDDDLWLLEPELRLELSDEEAVEEWRIAQNVLGSLVAVADQINLATIVAVMDAERRAGIACARARERVRRASLQEEE
jgi:hypothetical protein